MDQDLLYTRNRQRGALPEKKASLFFYGDRDSPFLAPRGIHTSGNRLIVADTAQNRVFVWNRIPASPYQAPDLVLGQSAFSGVRRNAGGDTDASSLLYPSGVWSDGEKLILADAWNHRVLVWHDFPVANAQPADIVIGQPDMQSNLPNLTGVGSPASARNLYWPYGVWSDGRHLWIADTGNRRVLFYDTIPTHHYAAADRVIGQDGFTEKDYNGNHAVWPYAVKVAPEGRLAIADTQYFRILVWKHWEDAFRKEPDLIIGQRDLEGCGQNQYQLHPGSNTLNWCYDMIMQKDALWVADTGNSRILYFERLPSKNNEAASGLYGNLNFESIGEHLEVGINESERLYWPFALSLTDDNKLLVADTGNHRVVIYEI